MLTATIATLHPKTAAERFECDEFVGHPDRTASQKFWDRIACRLPVHARNNVARRVTAHQGLAAEVVLLIQLGVKVVLDSQGHLLSCD